MSGLRLLLPVPDEVPDLFELYDHPGPRYVRAGLVASLDGAVAVGGRSAPLSGTGDRAVFRVLRAVCDVVLVGAGTVRAEDYRGVRIGPAGALWRAQHDRTAAPPVAVVSRALALDPAARLFHGPLRPLVVTCASSPEPVRRSLGQVADVVVAGERQVDLPQALDVLAGRGLGRVLCEGGPELLQTVLAAGALDELCITTAPTLVGTGPGLLPGGLGAPCALRLLHLLTDADGSLLARYAVG